MEGVKFRREGRSRDREKELSKIVKSVHILDELRLLSVIFKLHNSRSFM